MGTDKPCFDEISIDNYISNEYSICREERQYALYLNNILMKYRTKESRQSNVNDIFKACGLDSNVSIEKVFYEATFMRDIFERNRRIELSKQVKESDKRKRKILLQIGYRPKDGEKTVNTIQDKEKSFNRKLIKYLKDNNLTFNGDYDVVEYNLGGKLYDYGEDVKSMMNSKPDIAVIYEKGGERYLHFIECKFESSESANGGLKQSEIQWYIADFLCQNYFKDEDVKVSPEMKNNKSCLVRFTRKKNEENNKNEICIKDLISLNNKIFGINCDNDNDSEKRP